MRRDVYRLKSSGCVFHRDREYLGIKQRLARQQDGVLPVFIFPHEGKRIERRRDQRDGKLGVIAAQNLIEGVERGCAPEVWRYRGIEQNKASRRTGYGRRCHQMIALRQAKRKFPDGFLVAQNVRKDLLPGNGPFAARRKRRAEISRNQRPSGKDRAEEKYPRTAHLLNLNDGDGVQQYR